MIFSHILIFAFRQKPSLHARGRFGTRFTDESADGTQDISQHPDSIRMSKRMRENPNIGGATHVEPKRREYSKYD